MANRGTSNSPDTRNPERQKSHPNRLDQFAEDMFSDHDKGYGESVTSRKEKRKWMK
jgi:hypothetical protein